MPLQKFEVKPGDPISAKEYTELLKEVRRLGNLTVAAPLQMSNGPGGYTICLGTDVIPVAIVKMEAHQSSTYPLPAQNCVFFPAKKYPDISFDEDLNCNTLSSPGQAGDEIFVYNIKQKYIPNGRFLIAYKVNGLWWVDFVRPKVRGTLNNDILAGGNAEMTVAESSPTETITVHDWLLDNGQKITANEKITAFYDFYADKYYIDGFNQRIVLAGTTSGSISSGGTGGVITSIGLLIVRNNYSQAAPSNLACHIARVGSEWHLISLDCGN